MSACKYLRNFSRFIRAGQKGTCGLPFRAASLPHYFRKVHNGGPLAGSYWSGLQAGVFSYHFTRDRLLASSRRRASAASKLGEQAGAVGGVDLGDERVVVELGGVGVLRVRQRRVLEHHLDRGAVHR
jgi:hypothetical protein